MSLRFAHAGDFHLDGDRSFAETAQCLEWFVADAIRASLDLFVINGDLTTYKANLQYAARRGHSLRNAIPGRNRGSSGCCQCQGVRAHAAPGHRLGGLSSSNLHLPHPPRLGTCGSRPLRWEWIRIRGSVRGNPGRQLSAFSGRAESRRGKWDGSPAGEETHESVCMVGGRGMAESEWRIS